MPNYSNQLKQDNPQIVSSPGATTGIHGSQGSQGHGTQLHMILTLMMIISLSVYILRNQKTDMLLKHCHPNRV